MTDSVDFAKAMADETRQRVMRLLCCRWLCVGDVVNELDGISQPTVSHHLGVLREAGLVYVRREGKQVFYSLNPVSYTHLRAHETVLDLVCRLLLEKKNKHPYINAIHSNNDRLNNNKQR